MVTPSKKIMFFCNVDTFLISHRFNLIKRAVDDGYDVHVVCLITQSNQKFRELQITIHPINLKREGNSILNLVISFFHFVKILYRERPTILHCITSKPNLIGGLGVRLIKVPRVIIAISGFGVVTSEKTIFGIIRKKILFSLFRLLFNRPNFFLVTQNPSDYDKCRSFTSYTNQIHMFMGSGVDLKAFQPPIKTRKIRQLPVVLFASRLLKSKGIETFIELSRQKHALEDDLNIEKIEFWVAGKFDRANPECIDSEIIDLEVKTGNIKYLGDVADMADLLQNVSVLVLPSSYGEGLPKIVCEAASCGVPAIVSDIPGCRYAIDENITGLLVQGSSADLYFDKLREILGNSSRLEKMSISAREFAEENFDLNTITDNHFRIYNS